MSSVNNSSNTSTRSLAERGNDSGGGSGIDQSIDQYIDLDTFDELKEVLGSELGDVITAFVADSEQRITAIEKAVEHADFVSAGNLSHSLKGSALNLGASGLARNCFSLEHAVKSRTGPNALPALRTVLDDLENNWSLTRAFMLQQL